METVATFAAFTFLVLMFSFLCSAMALLTLVTWQHIRDILRDNGWPH